jgi:hypothetical protein
MAVKLAILKSGENIIADIKEYINDREEVVSLVFSNPYAVKLLTPELLMETSVGLDGEVEHRVSFYPWMVLSQDKTIAVDPQWVISIVNPHEWIKSSYEQKMNLTVEGQQSEPSKENNVQLIENFEVITEEKDG